MDWSIGVKDEAWSQNLNSLSPKELKAYRERFRYWSRKGLPEESAHQKACRTWQKKPATYPSHHTSDKASEPSPEAVAALVRQLKKQGSMAERPHLSLVNETQQAWQVPAAGLAEKPGLLLTAACTLGALATTALLVSASLEVFGYSWQGWLKAGLIEAGIVFLVLSSAKDLLTRIVKRGTACVLIGLSFLVLHTGAAKLEHANVKEALVADEEAKRLRQHHQALVVSLENLPENFVTKRTELLEEMDQVGGRLSAKLEGLRQAPSVQLAQRTGLAETILRACLVVLNLFFCHGLLQRLPLAHWQEGAII